MLNSDPLARLETLTATVASQREAAKAENRRRFPELAEIMDGLTDARVVCVHDHEGNLLLGRPPPLDSFVAVEWGKNHSGKWMHELGRKR